MSRKLYQCVAADLATRPVETTSLDTTVGEAATWLQERGYDAAPVVDGTETPIGFVTPDHVMDVADETPLEDVIEEITLEHIISGDATFDELLDALRQQPYYFLGGRNRVSGVLTRADVNTSPARIHLFDRITLLEEHLRELILEEAPDWQHAAPVSANTIDRIEERHDDAQSANIALEPIHYAEFSTLETVVGDLESCWRACGFSAKGQAKTALHEVTELRNAVAHANLLVENTDTDDGFLHEGRTIENLQATYGTIVECLEALQASDYTPQVRSDKVGLESTS